MEMKLWKAAWFIDTYLHKGLDTDEKKRSMREARGRKRVLI